MDAKTKKDGSLVSMSTILSPRELEVITIIYRDKLTQQEAADEFGYSQQHVSRIHESAISKLEVAFGSYGEIIFDFDE